MADKVMRLRQASWSGGVNRNNDLVVGDHQCGELLNARLQLEGTVSRRNGNFRMHTSALPNPGWGLHFFKGTARFYAHADARLYYSSVTNEETPGMTWATLSGVASYTRNYVQFRDFVFGTTNACTYVCDGIAAFARFTDVTYTVVGGGTPVVACLAVYNRRLFGANGNTLYWSALDDGDSLGVAGAGGGSAIIRVGDLGLIAGLMVVGDTLVIVHQHGVSKFTGWSQDDIAIQSGTSGVDSDFGTAAPNSCVQIDGTGYFVHPHRGLIETNGATATSVSLFIDSTFTSFLWFNSTVQVAQISAHEIAVINASNLAFLVYHKALRAWAGNWNFLEAGATPIAAQALFKTDSGFAFLGSDGFVRWQDMRPPAAAIRIYDDLSTTYTGGTPVRLMAQTQGLDGGAPFLEKSLRFLQGQATTIDPNTQFSIDEGLTVLASGPIPEQVALHSTGMFRVGVRGRGYSPSVTIVEGGTSPPARYGAVEITAFVVGERGGIGGAQ